MKKTLTLKGGQTITDGKGAALKLAPYSPPKTVDCSKVLTQDVRDHLAEIDPAILLADGFEDAFLGLAWVFNTPHACYDREKCIEILMRRDGMAEEDAEEFFGFNVEGAHAGKYTPAYLSRVVA
jgi:hypothetical protein